MTVGMPNIFCPISTLNKVVLQKAVSAKHIHIPVIVSLAEIFQLVPKILIKFLNS